MGRWRTFGALLAAGLFGVLAVIPYTFALAPPQAPAGSPPMAVLILASLLQNGMLLAVVIAIGLWLGPRVGLGAPLLRDLLLGVPGSWARVRRFLAPAAVAGAVSGGLVLALDVFVFAPNMPHDPGMQGGGPAAAGLGFLASFYGGIDEEVLLRLGLMTLLVWLGALATRSAPGTLPPAAVLWTANIVAALLFGAGHLPATAMLVALTPLVVMRALVLNGLVGVVCGYLYWRESILAAMVAHFCADLVLHVLWPLLLGPA